MQQQPIWSESSGEAGYGDPVSFTFGNRRLIDHLIADLEDESDFVRERAARELGEVGSAKARDGLLSALNDKSSIVRKAAIEGLGECGGREAVCHLADLLADFAPDSTQRGCIVQALGKIGGSYVISRVVPYLTNSSEHLRLDAVTAL